MGTAVGIAPHLHQLLYFISYYRLGKRRANPGKIIVAAGSPHEQLLPVQAHALLWVILYFSGPESILVAQSPVHIYASRI